MAYSFAHYCPRCRVPTEVFVNESERPGNSTCYRYHCPRCVDEVTYSPSLFLHRSTIPAYGVVATRFQSQGNSVPAGPQWEPGKSPNSTESSLVPQPAERKGPLSALGVRKIVPSDSSPEVAEQGIVCESFEEVASLRGHRGWVRKVAFASNRSFVASGGSEGGIKLWRFQHHGPPEQTIPYNHSGGVQGLALSPDTQRLASAAVLPDGVVRLWDLASQKPRLRALLQVPKISVDSLAFSPQGTLLAISCDQSILLWNVAKPTLREDERLIGHTQPAKEIVFAPDGLSLASACADGTISLWSLDKPVRQRVVLEGSHDEVPTLAFDSTGKWLAWGGQDNCIHVWEVNGGRPRKLTLLEGHKAPVRWVSFPLDSQTLLSGDQENRFFLWDLASAKRIRQWQLPGGTTVASIACTCDGRYLAAGTMGIVTVYRLYPKTIDSARNGAK